MHFYGEKKPTVCEGDLGSRKKILKLTISRLLYTLSFELTVQSQLTSISSKVSNLHFFVRLCTVISRVLKSKELQSKEIDDGRAYIARNHITNMTPSNSIPTGKGILILLSQYDQHESEWSHLWMNWWKWITVFVQYSTMYNIEIRINTVESKWGKLHRENYRGYVAM